MSIILTSFKKKQYYNSKSKKLGKIRFLKFVIALCFAIFIAVPFLYCKYYNFHPITISMSFFSNYFKIRYIDVDMDIESQSSARKEQIIQYSSISNNDTIFSISTWNIKNRLEQEKDIKSAVVKIQLPDRVQIVIKRRKPVLILKQKEKFVLIDEDGFEVVNNAVLQNNTKLPLIIVIGNYSEYIGRTLHNNLAINQSILEDDEITDSETFVNNIELSTEQTKKHQYKFLSTVYHNLLGIKLFSHISSIVLINMRRIDLYIDNGTIIKLPRNDHDISDVFVYINTVFYGKILSNKLKVIDFRFFPKKLYITYR